VEELCILSLKSRKVLPFSIPCIDSTGYIITIRSSDLYSLDSRSNIVPRYSQPSSLLGHMIRPDIKVPFLLSFLPAVPKLYKLGIFNFLQKLFREYSIQNLWWKCVHDKKVISTRYRRKPSPVVVFDKHSRVTLSVQTPLISSAFPAY
jgi:hypothetical protein